MATTYFMRLRLYLVATLSIVFGCGSELSAAVTDYVLMPDPQVEVSSLSTIKIRFPEAKFLGMYGSSLGGVTLTSATDPATVYVPVQSSYSTLNEPDSQSFLLARADDVSKTPVIVDTPGKYRLHFPQSCFELCGSWYTHLAWSDEIDVEYTISPDGEAGFDNYLPADEIGIYPLPGNVQEISSVSLQLPIDESEDFVTAPGISFVSLRRIGAAPGEDEYTVAACTYDLEKTITLTFRPAGSPYPQAVVATTPGEYVLTLPAGAIAIPTTGAMNPAMEIRYNVTGAPADSFRSATLTPAAGTLSQIDEIIVDFPDLKGELNFPDGVTDVTNYLNGAVTLTLLNTDESLQKEYIPYSATLMGPHTVALRFRRKLTSSLNPAAEVIRERGDYLLNIPPNTFKEKGDDFSFNGRIQALYTIDRPAVKNPMEVYEINPADGVSIGSLETISLTFPELTSGMRWPFDYSGIRITNVDNPEQTYKALSVVMQGNMARWGFNTLDTQYDYNLTLDTPGTYRISIPAGILIDSSNPAVMNPAIESTFTIDPRLNFTYTLSPDPAMAVESLSRIVMTPSAGCTLDINRQITASPTLRSAAGVSYVVSAEPRESDDILFTLPDGLTPGNWTLIIPAGYLVETHDDGMVVSNPDELRITYRIVTPTEYEWDFNPASGSRMTGLPVVALTPLGDGLRKVELVDDAPVPFLSGNGSTYRPDVAVNGYSVVLSFPDDLHLIPGRYTLDVPAAMMRTYDADGLSALNPPISATYEIIAHMPEEFTDGIFFLNEGWYGTDYGSINYLDAEYREMSYKVFQMANNGRYVGVTSQYGDIFGHDFMVISKQTSYSDAQSLLTIADATDMTLRQQIGLGAAAGRSVLGIDPRKAYIATSSGVMVYHTDTNTLGSMIAATESSTDAYSDQIGEMVRFREWVYAVRQGMGVYVIDPDSDDVVAEISLPEVTTVFVTGGGMLCAATADPASPFVIIDPEDFSLTPVNIDGTDASTLAAGWDSWKKAPLAAAVRGNVIYYATTDSDATIASYDFDTSEFKHDFVRLPAGVALYATAVSVDPLTGYIVIQAVEHTTSMRYNRNTIYFANPETGELQSDLTFRLEDHYWFPAMAIYPVTAPPVIAQLPAIYLSPEAMDFTVDAGALTTLSVGNSHLITYEASLDDTSVCSLTQDSYGKYTLSPLHDGTATLTLTASYRGLAAETQTQVVVAAGSGIHGVADEAERQDIYGIDGTLLMQGATPDDVNRLAPGIYIVGNRKVCKK